jgi:hypothetical protein
VNVTDCPTLDGLGVDASVVVVDAGLTVTLTAAELLLVKLAVPV